MKTFLTHTLAALLMFCTSIVSAQSITFGYVSPAGNPPSGNEACLGYQVYFEWAGFSSQVDYIEIPLRNSANGNPYRVRISAVNPQPPEAQTSIINYGTCTNATTSTAPNICGRMQFTLPIPSSTPAASAHDGVISGPVNFYDVLGNQIGTFTLNIANPEVGMGSLPLNLCSQDTLPLSGTPKGGIFTIISPNMGAVAPTPQYLFEDMGYGSDTVFIPAGDTITHFNDITPANYRKSAVIKYTYYPKMSDGTVCPTANIIQDTVIVRENRDFNVLFSGAQPTSHPLKNDVSSLVPSTAWSGIISNDPSVTHFFSGNYISSNNLQGQTMSNAGATCTTTSLLIDNGGCVSSDPAATVCLDFIDPGFPVIYCQGAQTDTFDRFDVFTNPDIYTTSAIPGAPFCDSAKQHIFVATFNNYYGSSYSTIYYEFRYRYQGQPYPGGYTIPSYSNALQIIDPTYGQEFHSINPALLPLNQDVTLYLGMVTLCENSIYNIKTYTVTIRAISPTLDSIPTSLQGIQPTFCHNNVPISFDGFEPEPEQLRVVRLGVGGGTVAVLNQAPWQIIPTAAGVHPNIYNDALYAVVYDGPCGIFDTLNFTIRGKVRPYFVDSDTAFEACRNDPAEVLSPFPQPSTGSNAYYTGGPWIDSSGTFYPFNVPILSNSAAVTYTFIDVYGCMSDSSRVFTIHDVPQLSFTTNDPNNQFCANDSVGYLIGTPISGVYNPTGGSYFGPTISGPQDSAFQPNAVYFPTIPNTTGYVDFIYRYTDGNGCSSADTLTVSINPIPQPSFAIDPYFCESDPPYQIQGVANVNGTTREVFYTTAGDTLSVDYNGNPGFPYLTAFYDPNPNYPNTLLTGIKMDTIVYMVADSTPCIGRDTQIVTVFPNPSHYFIGVNGLMDTTDQACLGRDTITLHSSLTYGITDFEGPGILFGTNEFVADVAGVGPHILTSYFTDTSNSYMSCRDTFVDTFYVHSTPNVEYAVDGGCGGVDIIFIPNNSILGLNRYLPGTTTLYDSITTAIWDYGDGNVASANYSVGPVQNTIDSSHHLYSTPGVYITSLFVENRGFCSDSDTVRVIVLPTTIASDTVPYYEDFEASDGGWIEEAEIGNQSSNIWYWSVAGGIRIKTTTDPNHNKVWVTHPNDPYGQNESGWVYSPCIDVSNLERPMIKLDYFSDTDPGNDGVVIEYYNEAIAKWLPLGNVSQGINWYNQSVIAGRPGIQDLAPKGWSGAFGTWRDARYVLDNLNSYTKLRLRIAFGAVGVSQGGYEGFAFDKVWIGNRTRNVLLEHFTNYDLPNFDAANSFVYNLIYGTSLVKDVVLVQYHTDQPGTDQFNNDNRQDPSARILTYGIDMNNSPVTAKSVIDGKGFGAAAPSSTNLTAADFEYDMLESPKFDINIDTFIVTTSDVQVRATITANENIAAADYIVRILILEDSMAYFTGEKVHSVLRKILPDAAGTSFSSAWTMGQSQSVTESWSFSGTNYDPNRFTAVVFIQKNNNTDKTVLQVASSRDLTAYIAVLGSEEMEELVDQNAVANSMVVYPNPTQGLFYARFDKPLPSDYRWQIIDLRGSILREGQAVAGTQQLELEAYDWASGMYILMLRNEKFSTQRKIVILNNR